MTDGQAQGQDPTSAPSADDHLVVRFEPLTGVAAIQVRTDAAHAPELYAAAKEAGLRPSWKGEFSFEAVVGTVFLVVWAGSKLTPLIQAILKKDEHVEFEFFENGTLKRMTGINPDKAPEVLENIQRAYERDAAEWLRISGKEPGPLHPDEPEEEEKSGSPEA